jgi:hypothetical protein
MDPRLMTASASACVLAAGCFGADWTGPHAADDFDLRRASSFAIDGDCVLPTAVAYDDDRDQILVLEQRQGVLRYTPDGVFLGTVAASADGWFAMSPLTFTSIGDGDVAVVDSDGKPLRMSLEGGQLTDWSMSGLALGHSLAFDARRALLWASLASADVAAPGDPSARLLRIDPSTGTRVGEVRVGAPDARAIAYAADLDGMWVLDWYGNLTLVDPTTGAARARAAADLAASSMAWDASRARLLTYVDDRRCVTSYEIRWR